MPSRIELPDKLCKNCNKSFGRYDCNQISDFRVQKFCSRKCHFKFKVGPNHPNWKGGFKTRPDGYIRDSRTDKYVHRIVMENSLGRKLKNSEHIHHIDGNPKNNNISNLMVVSNREHRIIEASLAKRGSNGRFIHA